MIENANSNKEAEKEENKAPENANNPPTVVAEDQEAGGKDRVKNNMSAEKAILGKKMVELSTILTILVSLPIIFMAVWLLYMKGFECENLLRMQDLQVGISWFMIAIFLISNAIVFFRARFPIPGLLLIMVPLLVMFTVGLALVGTYKLESTTIKGSPMWFKSKVYDHSLWNEIESCLYHDSKACSDVIRNSMTLKSDDLPTTRLSAIKSGCCRPPMTCGMEYVNATFWLKKNGAMDGSNTHDPDCDLWENDETIMCYNCNSCKQGFYTTLKSKWWRFGVFLVSMAVFLIVSHLLLFFSTMLERYNQI